MQFYDTSGVKIVLTYLYTINTNHNILEMGILNNIVVSIPDTIAIVTIPREDIFHSCLSATTTEDIELAKIVCVTILIALLIISFVLGYCVNSMQRAKQGELEKRNSHEISKMQEEFRLWKERSEHEASRKAEEHKWKVAYDDKWKEKDHQYEVELRKIKTDSASKDKESHS